MLRFGAFLRHRDSCDAPEARWQQGDKADGADCKWQVLGGAVDGEEPAADVKVQLRKDKAQQARRRSSKKEL